MLVEWGLGRVDRRGLEESWLQATEEGVPLYDSCDFVAGEEIELRAPPPPAEMMSWRSEEQVLPFQDWPMWRAKGGDRDAVAPWLRPGNTYLS